MSFSRNFLNFHLDVLKIKSVCLDDKNRAKQQQQKQQRKLNVFVLLAQRHML